MLAVSCNYVTTRYLCCGQRTEQVPSGPIRLALGWSKTYSPLSTRHDRDQNRIREEEESTDYADTDFANDKDNRKSVSGHALTVFGNLVAWSTKRQPTVSLSSTEAELISLCTAVKEGLWLTNLLHELSVVNTSFTIMEDNIPCIRIAEEPRSHQRMQHLDLKYLFVRELIAEGKLHLKHINTNEQPADAFTKGLPRLQHRKLMNSLNVRIEGRC